MSQITKWLPHKPHHTAPRHTHIHTRVAHNHTPPLTTAPLHAHTSITTTLKGTQTFQGAGSQHLVTSSTQPKHSLHPLKQHTEQRPSTHEGTNTPTSPAHTGSRPASLRLPPSPPITCRARMRSSTVPLMVMRVTCTGRVWPMRCARSMACSSVVGFHHRSSSTTWLAHTRFTPESAGVALCCVL